MKKLYLILVMVVALTLCLCIVSVAQDTAPESYVSSETAYTVYNDAQYQEVILGIYNNELENKTIVFGCDILVTLDFVMTNPCDITIDLNGFKYTNNTINNKSGDFDFQNGSAIIRIKNGSIESNFCVFIFRTSGQLYAESIEVVSHDECVYRYGGSHNAIVSLKNCKMNATADYYAVNLNGNCGCPQGSEGGSLYQIEGGEYGGLAILCPRDGSYVRDCLVYEKNLCLDTWHRHAGTSSAPKNVELEVRNVKVTSDSGEIYLNDVGLSPILYDCTFKKINLSNKSDAVIISYTSPTCENPGTKTKYYNLTSISVDEQYSIDNPAKGHTANLDEILDLVYENGFNNAGTYICTCTECGAMDIKEKTPSASALITFVGISAPMNGNGICIGYAIGCEAIETYKSYEKTFEYCVVAYIPLENETNVDPIGTDLKPIDYTISTPLSAEYSAVDFVINGFGSHVDTPLAMCAYVYDGSEVDYLNASISETVSISQDDYVSTITLASVLAYAKSFE